MCKDLEKDTGMFEAQKEWPCSWTIMGDRECSMQCFQKYRGVSSCREATKLRHNMGEVSREPGFK